GPPLTSPAAEWYETMSAGRSCETNVARACVSGSDKGAGPPPPGTSTGPVIYVSVVQSLVGQFRFGSTPLASMRLSFASPSGLADTRKVKPIPVGVKLGSLCAALNICCTSSTVLASCPACNPPTISTLRLVEGEAKSTSARC